MRSACLFADWREPDRVSRSVWHCLDGWPDNGRCQRTLGEYFIVVVTGLATLLLLFVFSFFVLCIYVNVRCSSAKCKLTVFVCTNLWSAVHTCTEYFENYSGLFRNLVQCYAKVMIKIWKLLKMNNETHFHSFWCGMPSKHWTDFITLLLYIYMILFISFTSILSKYTRKILFCYGLK